MSISAPERTYQKPTQLDAWLYLDEITHRTLNDYAAMLSILRCASRTTTDAVGLLALDAVARRLEAAAAGFNALRPMRGSRVRNLDDDLERLCASLTTSVLSDRSISLTLASEGVCLSAQRSWQISLIVSELIMNAAKHAFSSTTQGTIVVKVRVLGAHIQCAVVDNGVADECILPGRGSGIVDALAADLGGTIARNFSTNGSTVVLYVPAGC